MKISVTVSCLFLVLATTVTDSVPLTCEDLMHHTHEFKPKDDIYFTVRPEEIKFEVGTTADLIVEASKPVSSTKLLCVHYQKLNGTHLIDTEPDSVVSSECAVLYSPPDLPAQKTGIIRIRGERVGTETLLLYTSDSPDCGVDHVKVHVVHAQALTVLGDIIGWVYFISWSLSFYPQIIKNYKKKSVVGLNFDFACINVIGYWSYTFFNIGLFFIPAIQNTYLAQHSGGVIPVRVNDVFFALHNTVMTSTLILQIIFYDRGGQSVSKMACCLVSSLLLFIIISFVLDLADVINWLTFLYFLSYIKLGCTTVMYTPQVYMNFSRKSTKGWSIYMVLMNFIGGAGSVIQMLLLAYNNDDWGSVSGNLAKLGLGLVSVFFDIVFFIQHFCLYRAPKNAYHTDHEMVGKNHKAIESHNECVRASPVSIEFM